MGPMGPGTFWALLGRMAPGPLKIIGFFFEGKILKKKDCGPWDPKNGLFKGPGPWAIGTVLLGLLRALAHGPIGRVLLGLLNALAHGPMGWSFWAI